MIATAADLGTQFRPNLQPLTARIGSLSLGLLPDRGTSSLGAALTAQTMGIHRQDDCGINAVDFDHWQGFEYLLIGSESSLAGRYGMAGFGAKPSFIVRARMRRSMLGGTGL